MKVKNQINFICRALYHDKVISGSRPHSSKAERHVTNLENGLEVCLSNKLVLIWSFLDHFYY